MKNLECRLQSCSVRLWRAGLVWWAGGARGGGYKGDFRMQNPELRCPALPDLIEMGRLRRTR